MTKDKSKKVPIDSEALYALIKSKTSIRKLGPATGFNEKTIRRGLKEGRMSAWLVMMLGIELGVDPRTIGNFEAYGEKLLLP